MVNRIKTWQENGGALEQCAILYRSNAQSRVLEEALLQVSMPYRIYGGMRFFERQEIKDALSYLRLIANRNDDAAFERVVNTPTRGIGDRTLDVVRQASRDRQLTLWQACRELLQEKALCRARRQRIAALPGVNRRAGAGNGRHAAARPDRPGD